MTKCRRHPAEGSGRVRVEREWIEVGLRLLQPRLTCGPFDVVAGDGRTDRPLCQRDGRYERLVVGRDEDRSALAEGEGDELVGVGPPASRRISRDRRYSGTCSRDKSGFVYRAFTFSGSTFQTTSTTRLFVHSLDRLPILNRPTTPGRHRLQDR